MKFFLLALAAAFLTAVGILLVCTGFLGAFEFFGDGSFTFTVWVLLSSLFIACVAVGAFLMVSGIWLSYKLVVGKS